MNQNLLIVDDEIEILSWLEELFTYDYKPEISVYTAGSAAEALKLLNRIRFDVVLTDIRMPGMDGITLFEHIKENWPKCKTIFLTGYRNFEDIYRVIHHKDVQYILKSEDDDVILKAVKTAFDQIQIEIEQDRLQRKQEQQLKQARYWMQREIIDKLCAGMIPERLSEQFQELKILIQPEQPILVYLLRVDAEWSSDQDLISAQKRFFWEEQLVQSLKSCAPGKVRLHLHMMERRQFLLLIQPEDSDWERAAAVSYGMLECAQELFHQQSQVAFSGVVHEEPIYFEQLPIMLRCLRERMNRWIGGARNVIRKEKNLLARTEIQVPGVSEVIMGRVNQLLSLLELRKKKEYFEVLGECQEELIRKKSLHDAPALELYYSISIRLSSFINENYLNEELAFQIGIYKLTMAESHESWSEAARYLWEISEAIFGLMDKNEDNLTQRTLNRVIAYIEAHLSDELSLTVLAEVGGFNASYLSRIFKQVKGEGLSEFILHRRMELAKQLLVKSDGKIQEIAVKTGYLSAHSFTRVFRTELGISPTEYRALHRNG